MSDELEHRLREAGLRLPGPDDTDTAAARSAFLAAAGRGRRSGRRMLVLAFAALLVVGGAFGVGYAVAAGGGGKPRVVHVRAALDAGPGFLPSAGWDTVSSGTATPVQVAVAANVALAAGDRRLVGPPVETARRLGPNGVLLYALFEAPTAERRQALLPLQLDQATAAGRVAGMPAVGSARRLHVRVAAWDVDVLVVFGAARPSAGVLAAAREELGRLVVPACPDARPLGPDDVETAKAYLLAWLPAHYPGPASDVAGATATAAAGAQAPRSGQAERDCGRTVALGSVEVDVVLPELATVSASLSELTYFVAKTPSGWTVWERAR